ncbi:MAG: hypothetical protein WAZ77_24290 [Candidatus Nitrosopolaris sp.]
MTTTGLLAVSLSRSSKIGFPKFMLVVAIAIPGAADDTVVLPQEAG